MPSELGMREVYIGVGDFHLFRCSGIERQMSATDGRELWLPGQFVDFPGLAITPFFGGLGSVCMSRLVQLTIELRPEHRLGT